MGGMYRELTEHRRTELQHFLKMVGKAHGEQVRALAAWEVYDKVRHFPRFVVLLKRLKPFMVGGEVHWWDHVYERL